MNSLAYRLPTAVTATVGLLMMEVTAATAVATFALRRTDPQSSPQAECRIPRRTALATDRHLDSTDGASHIAAPRAGVASMLLVLVDAVRTNGLALDLLGAAAAAAALFTIVIVARSHGRTGH